MEQLPSAETVLASCDILTRRAAALLDAAEYARSRGLTWMTRRAEYQARIASAASLRLADWAASKGIGDTL